MHIEKKNYTLLWCSSLPPPQLPHSPVPYGATHSEETLLPFPLPRASGLGAAAFITGGRYLLQYSVSHRLWLLDRERAQCAARLWLASASVPYICRLTLHTPSTCEDDEDESFSVLVVFCSSFLPSFLSFFFFCFCISRSPSLSLFPFSYFQGRF